MFSLAWKTVSPVPLLLAVVLGVGGATPATAQTSKPRATQSKAKKQEESKKDAAKLDLNRATAEEMAEKLPGVGEATARKIVAGRPYTAIDDLLKVGVPARTVDAIRPLVKVVPASVPGSVAESKTATKTATPAKSTARGKAAVSAEPKAATPGAPATATATAPAPPGPRVNLNTATIAKLQTLPGVGPTVARAIVGGRPYRSINDLERVRGLGAARINTLRDRITVAPPVSAPNASSATPRAKTKTATTPRAERLAPGQVVNINTAPKEQLDRLPGIGPVKAQAIIDARPFKTKEDIMKVKGIKEGEFARIKDLIRVD